MLRVTVYLKSGAVAEFHAATVFEDAADHPKFRLAFAAPDGGRRRLVYLDRDDVSAVVVESDDATRAESTGMATAIIDLSPPDPDATAVLTVPVGPAAP